MKTTFRFLYFIIPVVVSIYFIFGSGSINNADVTFFLGWFVILPLFVLMSWDIAGYIIALLNTGSFWGVCKKIKLDTSKYLSQAFLTIFLLFGFSYIVVIWTQEPALTSLDHIKAISLLVVLIFASLPFLFRKPLKENEQK